MTPAPMDCRRHEQKRHQCYQRQHPDYIRFPTSAGYHRTDFYQQRRPRSHRKPDLLGALQAWNTYGPNFVTAETDENGLVTENLEEVIKQNIKFMYVLPNFQNPLGVTMTLERRKQLIELASKYAVPLIEDDPYGKLIFEGEPLPSIAVLDTAYHSNGSGEFNGNVIHTSTFSKILAPGLRIGWVVAPTTVMKKMVQAKQGADLQWSTFDQYVAYEMASADWLPDHIEKIKRVYKERRDTMLKAFEDYMPEGTSWTTPAVVCSSGCVCRKVATALNSSPKRLKKKLPTFPATLLSQWRSRQYHAHEFLGSQPRKNHRRRPPFGEHD